MRQALAERLWAGPLDDPAAPGRALVTATDYARVLPDARALVAWRLPLDLPSLQQRWPWSIDLALLSVEAEGDIAPLRRAVETQGRRHGVLARALWSLGRDTEAIAVLDALDQASETYDEDRATRAELLVLSDREAEPLAGPRGALLSLVSTWRRAGAAALTRRVMLDAPSLPAHPPLWDWLIDHFVQERDLERARWAFDRLAALVPDHPDLLAHRIRLALESEDHATARGLLESLPDASRPWRWTARRHVQLLRCLADEIAAQPSPDYAPLRAHADAALRLFPGNGILSGLYLAARELTDPWDELARDLAQWPDRNAAARTLVRLGLPDEALACLDAAGMVAPDDRVRLRLRRAEALLRKGALASAAEALGPVPRAAPLAADHAYWTAEIAAARRDLAAARAALDPALDSAPTRMGLILTAARVAFLSGDATQAACHLARFRALKTAQRGSPPEDDLRDLIVRDAADHPDGPGRAAQAFARGLPVFRPVDDTAPIPQQIAHYWEGPRSDALDRSRHAWAKQFPQTLHDAVSARAWLAERTDLAPLFDQLTQPATRADLFRIAFLSQEGGIFADLDEFPRHPVADWLTGARAVLVVEEGHATIANNFLAAQPGLPLFARLLRRIAGTLAVTRSPYPWWHCGPAPLTQEALADRDSPGLRFLSQPDYEARVSTNLPFPHKRRPDHWR